MQTIEESQTLLNDTDCEEELKELAKLEKESGRSCKSRTEYAPRPAPPDPVDNRNVIIEIRAGTGGDEAVFLRRPLSYVYTIF